MATTHSKPALVFDAKEVCRVTGLDRLFLANWVVNGVVTPAVWGKRGTNCGHRFSVAQTIALAIIAALRDSPRRCGSAYAKLLLEHFESLDDAARDWWLVDAPDEAARESVAASTSGPAATRLFGDFGNPSLPSAVQTHKDIFRRLSLVADALRERGVPLGPAAGLDPAPGRMSGTPKTKRT
jgi:hypothetical protein